MTAAPRVASSAWDEMLDVCRDCLDARRARGTAPADAPDPMAALQQLGNERRTGSASAADHHMSVVYSPPLPMPPVAAAVRPPSVNPYARVSRLHHAPGPNRLWGSQPGWRSASRPDEALADGFGYSPLIKVLSGVSERGMGCRPDRCPWACGCSWGSPTDRRGRGRALARRASTSGATVGVERRAVIRPIHVPRWKTRPMVHIVPTRRHA